MNTISLLALASMILYTSVVILMALQMRVCHWIGEPISWMAWGIHGIIYTTVFLIDYRDGAINAQFYNTWASSVRLHGLIVLITIELLRYRRLRTQRHEC